MHSSEWTAGSLGKVSVDSDKVLCFCPPPPHLRGFPGGASGKEPACPCRRPRRRGFDPWVGKIPWRREWQPTPVLLPGKSHGRRSWKAAVHGIAKSWARQNDFTFTFHFHALEKEMATHSSVLAWRIPGTGEPGGLPSMGSHRVGHD